MKRNDLNGLGKENNEDDSRSSIYGSEEEDEEEDAHDDPLLSRREKNIEDPEIMTDEKPSTSGSSVDGKRKPLLERNVKKSKPKKKYDTQELVDRAILKLKEKDGSSVPAIKKSIMVEYPEMNEKRLLTQIKYYIKNAVQEGRIEKIKMSFKLSKSAAANERKKISATKRVVKVKKAEEDKAEQKLPKSVLTAEAKKKSKDGKALQPQEIVPIKITRAEAIIKPKLSPANPSVKTATIVPNANPEPDPKKSKLDLDKSENKTKKRTARKLPRKSVNPLLKQTASRSKTAKKKVSKDGEPLKAPNQADPKDINMEATSVKPKPNVRKTKSKGKKM
uniref:H15 domain-containing protein n=1 Tax=Glossina austeni TaxID=7395 RepID=A0A1A9VFV8_GLOAU